MSKLATVRAAMQANAKIQIVAVEENTYFPHRSNCWTHTVDFIVAPNRGIYSAAELQAFMETLIPGLPPTIMDRFCESESEMAFGKLYFDENLGEEIVRREFTFNESDFLPDGTVKDGKAVLEERRKIKRRTWVRLYPDLEIAMSHAEFENRIPRADLQRFMDRGHALGFVGEIGSAV